ncbi:cohesin domain-containing protein [Ruminococcus sp.]|uniref:cohesin domain-containing protein n=1 Tax=Ruminococcus sp. TaxID=41978 RepID=UPI001B52BB63|nr:cohesin domain-containing protein [Ruminococcus sp.]MBP5433142.1 cellulose-binding protein CttA-related protein [Ruminococcus sp.]
MKKLLSAVTSVAMSVSLMAGAFASSVSAAGSISAEQPNISMGEVLDVSAKTFAADGTVEWKIPTVTAAPGQTVTMPIVALGSSLEVSGGQFTIKAATPIKFDSIVTGNAYGYNIASNADENTFLFSGVKGKIAAENSVVGTLKFTIPADCAEGKYDVKWSEGTASAPKGVNVTDKVKFTDGAINVKKDAEEGTIEWVLDDVTAEPGEKVTLKAYVNNTEGSAIGVAGGQFVINADSPLKFDSVKGGGAYDAEIEVNKEGAQPAFLFSKFAKDGVVAADKAEIMTLTYVVPTDCAEGKYNVKWAEQTVSNGKAKNITSKVTFKDGSITVKKASADGKIKWVLGNETAAPGDTVELSAVVDSADAAVAIAGAQFTIASETDSIKLSSYSEKSEAYDAAISANIGKGILMFGKPGTAAVAAADGKTVVKLSFKVDDNCKEGTYKIKWADQSISNALSENITSKVQFVDGSITVASNAQKAITWDIEDVTVEPGTKSAALKVTVKGTSDLAIAGGQFGISAKSPITLNKIEGTPYGAELSKNAEQNVYLFAKTTGKAEADGTVIMTLTFDIPENCAAGTYAVEWKDTTVSAEKGVNVTSKVKFENGSITIGGTTTSSTTSVTTTSTTSNDGNPTTTTTLSGESNNTGTTTTTEPIVIPEDKAIAWIVGNAAGYAGDEVTIKVTVYDPNKSALAISGAMFDMASGDGAKLTDVSEVTAYSNGKVLKSDDKIRIMFFDNKGERHSAADGATVVELKYTIDKDAKPGTVIPVEIKDLSASGEKSENIASKIFTVKGSIIVLTPTTATSTTSSATTTSSSTSTDTNTTTTSSSTSSSTDTNTTTTSTSTDTNTTTTSSSTSSTSSTSTDTNTTTTSSSTSSTSSTSTDTNTSTTTTTTSTSTGTSTTTVTLYSTTSTSEGWVKAYATISTEAGFYFSHDDGTRENSGFQAGQVKALSIVDVYEDGREVVRKNIDLSLVNYHGATPEEVYNSTEHGYDNEVELSDFEYQVPAYYGDLALVDKTGDALTITAYIGVKGDITLNNMVDAVDCSIALSYYAHLSVNDNDPSAYSICGANGTGLKVPSGMEDIFENFAAFLGDVTENEWDTNNWSMLKVLREISAVDASQILSYYTNRSATSGDTLSNREIWDDIQKGKEDEFTGS